MKIAVNKCYGGFSLSDKACELLGTDDPFQYKYEARTNAKLISVIEELGEEADGHCASLEVVEIPDDATDWRISEYDGWEDVWYVLDGKMYEV